MLVAMIRSAGLDLRLIWIETRVDVHTFWAVLLDPSPFAPASTVNMGYGSHLAPDVAAVRAITEAAQSRLTFIHGAREDLSARSYRRPPEKVYRYFDRLKANTDWGVFADLSSDDFVSDYERVLSQLRDRSSARSTSRISLDRSWASPWSGLLHPSCGSTRKWYELEHLCRDRAVI